MIRTTIHRTLLAAAIATVFSIAHAADAPKPNGDYAQQTTTPTSNDGKPAAKKSGTAPQTQASTQNAVNLTGVTVTPLRDSLKSAQSIKQDSQLVVDSIVAEDIGKLPDNSVADALKRVTGVQVAQGFQGETSTVVIRGLPNAVTTLNGRQFFSSGGRQFSFQDLPSTAVSALNVYKSTDATMVTGGIAGTVDIRTFRPFDFDGFKVAGTLTETNQKYGAHTDPTASFLISNRWKTDYGEFGALLNAGINTMHYDYNVSYVDNNLTRVSRMVQCWVMSARSCWPIKANSLLMKPTSNAALWMISCAPWLR